MILTAGPSITNLEIEYVNDAVQNGWNENWNLYLKRLEEAFSSKFFMPHTLATSCCTGAMHMGLKALEIGAGDEVVVPELTWVATASAVRYCDAIPVFVDVDPETWTICPKSLEKAITPKTKVVMPVHLYGHPAKMDEVTAVAEKNNLRIFEDAAPAIGAKFRDQFTGTFGDLSAFSFQGAKLMVTGEGGMLMAKDSKLFAKIRQYAEHGRSADSNKGAFWIEEVGFKYKMSNIQAALGLAQFERLDELIEKKRQIFSWYEARLGEIDGIALNREADWAKSIYWMTSIYLKKNFKRTRNELIEFLKKNEVDSRPVFPAISNYPMWPTMNNPVANHIGQNAINLPSGHNLTEDQIDYVCKLIERGLL